MATQVASLGQVDVSAEQQRDPLHGWTTLALWLFAAGCMPVLWTHGLELWKKPHYQFALVLPIVAWLAMPFFEAERSDAPDHSRWVGPLGAALLAVLGLSAASYRISPWLAYVSCVLALLAAMWLYGGSHYVVRHWRIWALTVLAVPLPLGWDEQLILWLRGRTTGFSSRILDQFGVLHERYGNIIELPGKQLFIDDACSGVNSLFVLLSCAVIASLLFQRNLLHAALLVVSAAGLMFVENVGRIVVVAVAYGRGRDWSEGLSHTVLGGVCFVISLLLLLSADQFWLFVTHSVRGQSTPRTASLTRAREPSRFGIQATATLLALFPLVGAWHGASWALRPTLATVPFSTNELPLPDLGEDFLPAQVLGAQRHSFRKQQRSAFDPFGKNGQTWNYSSGDWQFAISVDYPYSQRHDFSLCYENIGWTSTRKVVLHGEALATACNCQGEPAVAWVEMRRERYGHGVLLYSMADLQGFTDAFLKGAEGAVFAPEIPTERVIGPLYSISMVSRSTEPLTADQQKQLLEAYLVVRRKLMTQLAAPPSTSKPTRTEE